MFNSYFQNPYYRNPFMSNPLLMMMLQINNQPMDPNEGNGLLHPVYVPPLTMHALQDSVPQLFTSPSLDNAKAGNMDCSKGATVSCKDSGQKIKTVVNGVIKIKEAQEPEKISCFAGCAEVNPCDVNLYSSFVKSEHSCDGSNFFYYTCESFEELKVFNNACQRHEKGAKVDVPIVTMKTTSKYATWAEILMKNRHEGKGREVMFDDDSIEPGMGTSVGGGEAGNSPITDKQLGNVLDSQEYVEDPDLAKKVEYSDDVFGFYEEYDENMDGNVMGYNDVVNRKHHDTLELVVMSVWGILFSVLFICFCCVMAVFCGFIVRKIRIQMMKSNRIERRYNDMNDCDDEEQNNDSLDDDSMA